MSPFPPVYGCVLRRLQRAKLLEDQEPETGMHPWLNDTDKNCGLGLPLLLKMHKIWSVDCQENYENYCHRMSDFKAKMNQIRFRLRLCPRPHWGSLQRSPRPLHLRGQLLRGGRGKEEYGREEEGRRIGPTNANSWICVWGEGRKGKERYKRRGEEEGRKPECCGVQKSLK